MPAHAADRLWENPISERRSSLVPASPYPQVTPEPELERRRVLGATLAECGCTDYMVVGRQVISSEI